MHSPMSEPLTIIHPVLVLTVKECSPGQGDGEVKLEVLVGTLQVAYNDSCSGLFSAHSAMKNGSARPHRGCSLTPILPHP